MFTVICNWTLWTEWSACNASCGEGVQIRSRSPTNPPASNGGANCTGESMQLINCQLTLCPGMNYVDWCEAAIALVDIFVDWCEAAFALVDIFIFCNLLYDFLCYS